MVVVGDVGTQEPAKVRLIENEGVIQALAANGPDEPLHEGLLPRGSQSDTDLANPHPLDAA
jgi:hypothetical protein